MNGPLPPDPGSHFNSGAAQNSAGAQGSAYLNEKQDYEKWRTMP